MNSEDFLSLCKKNEYKEKDIKKFNLALAFITEDLKDKKRLSGKDFLEHNLGVASILVGNRSVLEVVLAGLLHGHLKKSTYENIKTKFGDEVFALVKGVEELESIKDQNEKLDAEALRKIFLTALSDVRVILIKLANKLDNLRSIGFLGREEQIRIAEEVLDIYAPLAYRLGVDKIKTELEDLAFKTINPRKYEEISNYLKESRSQQEESMNETVELIKKIAGKQVKIIDIKGRNKHTYSIYKKIKKKGIRLTQLFDLLGIRIIVSTEKDCYSLLGLLHEKFEPIDGRLKDYIANPKPNLYRSIHTGIQLPSGKKLEVQIRTAEMDEVAEEGIAAHWRYKGITSEQLFEKKIAWLRGVLELKKNDDNRDLLEVAKVDVFGDSIFCYTPKGDVKEMPSGATILDFAYLIHEEVGNHAVAGRINGKFVALKSQVFQGDVVEIITNKNQRPRRGWIKIVKSGKARQKIRKSLREYESLPAFHFRLFKPIIKEDQGILVESEEFPKATCVLAKCCCPLPGEDIVGIVTKRKIISVHKQDCKQAIKEQDRWVPVNWKEAFNQKLSFFIKARERSGLLADLLHTIATAGFEVKEAKAKLIDLEHAQCSFLIIPKDLDHLKELIKRVNKVKGVNQIYFD
jgi:GTP diphosphokinase / guanosine-3',5'-bis(diphosphate) 3'-diphosphatase